MSRCNLTSLVLTLAISCLFLSGCDEEAKPTTKEQQNTSRRERVPTRKQAQKRSVPIKTQATVAAIVNPERMTRAQFINKLRDLKMPGGTFDADRGAYAATYKSIRQFKSVLGEPDNERSVDGFERRWVYRCTDGTLTLRVLVNQIPADISAWDVMLTRIDQSR